METSGGHNLSLVLVEPTSSWAGSASTGVSERHADPLRIRNISRRAHRFPADGRSRKKTQPAGPLSFFPTSGTFVSESTLVFRPSHRLTFDGWVRTSLFSTTCGGIVSALARVAPAGTTWGRFDREGRRGNGQ
jgi:hypothetical protein